MKSRIEDGDETSNLGEITASKLVFCYIANPIVNISAYGNVALDYHDVPLVIFVVLTISRFSALGSAALGFLVPNCPASGLLVLSLPNSPALPWLNSSIIPLVILDVFFLYSSLTLIVNDGIVKLLAEDIANFFGNNPSVISHCSHNDCISELVFISFEVAVANLYLAIFNA